MKKEIHPWTVPVGRLFLLVLLVWGAGCRPKNVFDLPEPTITGSRSDPPQVFTARWKTNHAYTVNFYLDQSTQVKIRRTDEDLPVDTRLRLDFNGSVTNSVAKNRVDVRQTVLLELTGMMFQLIRGENPTVYYDTSGRIPQLEDDQRTTEALDKLPNNVQWRYTLSEEGQVVSLDADMRQAKQALDHPSKPAGLTSFKRLFEPRLFRHYLEMNMIPRTAVKIGDSWPLERTMQLGQVGMVIFRGKCVFRGWQQNLGKTCARFDFEGTVASPTNTAKGILQMARNNSPLVESGIMQGKIWFDPEAGIPNQMNADMSVMVKPAARVKRVVTQPPPPAANRGGTNVAPGVRLDPGSASEGVESVPLVPVPPVDGAPPSAPAVVETVEMTGASSGPATPVHQRMKLKIMDLGPR